MKARRTDELALSGSVVRISELEAGDPARLLEAGAVVPAAVEAATAEAKAGTYKVPLGELVGPQGPQGDKGDTGATGAVGPQGPQGAQGTAGSGASWPGTQYQGITASGQAYNARLRPSDWNNASPYEFPNPSGSGAVWASPIAGRSSYLIKWLRNGGYHSFHLTEDFEAPIGLTVFVAARVQRIAGHIGTPTPPGGTSDPPAPREYRDLIDYNNYSGARTYLSFSSIADDESGIERETQHVFLHLGAQRMGRICFMG